MPYVIFTGFSRDYTIGEKIARGAGTHVYKAIMNTTQREYAVKRIPRSKVEQDERKV